MNCKNIYVQITFKPTRRKTKILYATATLPKCKICTPTRPPSSFVILCEV